MADFADLSRHANRTSVLPPIAPTLTIAQAVDDEDATSPEEALEPISAFVCIIEYKGANRLINCRRFKMIGEIGHVIAICETANAYREFRCDRIAHVFDVTTGERLGDGDFFARFAVNQQRDRATNWGLAVGRRTTLVAGLNILAFMARCDGHWHPLESDIIERFVCSMWLQNEWDGDPPIDTIVAHAQRVAPTSGDFFEALGAYARGKPRVARIMRRAVGELIAADGVICAAETQWGHEIEAFFRDYDDARFQQFFRTGPSSDAAICGAIG